MKPFGKCLFFVAVLLFFFFSCKKESFTTSPDALITTSVDTLHFDTVFTTTGSTSRFVKIINDNDKGIHVSSVRLAGGASSPFKINVDGLPGPQVSNIDVAADDSAYIYVTVTINPNATNLPFIVRDSIEITYNGNKKFVQLDAFGQNAHFFRDRVITANEIWNNDLPYVILGRLTVNPNATLTINKGSRIHMHADAPFIVHGTLQVNGEKYDSTKVVFTGDRLDEPYRDFPASYPGLIFSDVSKNNVINYAIIKNAYQGVVVVDPSSSGTKLTLNETIIDNAYDVGLGAVNSSITGRNLLISNCGQNMLLIGGGTYNFTHCTVASFSNAYIQHKKPVLIVSDYSTPNGTPIVNNLTASFNNCIFWGEANGFFDNEVVDSLKGTSRPSFKNVLWRMKTISSKLDVSGNSLNQDPLFDSINTNRRYFDFRLQKNRSPVIDKGANFGIAIDLAGNQRPRGLAPDLGAYEKQ